MKVKEPFCCFKRTPSVVTADKDVNSKPFIHHSSYLSFIHLDSRHSYIKNLLMEGLVWLSELLSLSALHSSFPLLSLDGWRELVAGLQDGSPLPVWSNSWQQLEESFGSVCDYTGFSFAKFCMGCQIQGNITVSVSCRDETYLYSANDICLGVNLCLILPINAVSLAWLGLISLCRACAEHHFRNCSDCFC